MGLHQCHYGTSCRLMRRPEVLALINVSKSTLHAWIGVRLAGHEAVSQALADHAAGHGRVTV